MSPKSQYSGIFQDDQHPYGEFRTHSSRTDLPSKNQPPSHTTNWAWRMEQDLITLDEEHFTYPGRSAAVYTRYRFQFGGALIEIEKVERVYHERNKPPIATILHLSNGYGTLALVHSASCAKKVTPQTITATWTQPSHGEKHTLSPTTT